MRYSLRLAALLFSFMILAVTAHAQKAQQAKIGCLDKDVRLQADEIKQHYVQQGFTVYRDAMLSMESMMPFPVVAQLTRGQLYRVIFVASPNSTKMRVETYNGRDQKLDEKVAVRSREQPSYIDINFIPEQSDDFLFILMQKWKAKDVCGSFTILKAKADAGPDYKFTPYTQQ